MKVGRNDPCPCGSGKKYKKCCLHKSNLGYNLYLKGKKAENFVYELAQKSFLADWCYQNPKLPNGKEICDLLVVYDEIAIIWQIKDLKLDKNGKYKESEVKENIHQLSTARRRLFELNLPIELENPRRGKEKFDPKLIKEIYLISALLGEGEDYFSFAEVVDGKVVHTFTREFTKIVLNELDTIKDFVEYLRQKESLISINNKIMLIGGERELLACYLTNERSFEKLETAGLVIIEEGLWNELQKRPEYIAKKSEDKISYGWDDIINRAHTCGGEYEKVAKELARPSRFERRLLSKAFCDAHTIAHNKIKENTFRRIYPLETEETTYCFVFLDDPEPRNRRKTLLSTICFIARGIHKENSKVIGIATEMKIRSECLYDFCLLEIPQWTDEEQKKMERLQKETGIFTNLKLQRVHEDEYPIN